MISPMAGGCSLISNPWKTPVPLAAFLIASLTNTECDIANLNSALVAPACLTHHEMKTADHATFVQLVKGKPMSWVHFLISLQRAGSDSCVNWNRACCASAIEANFMANAEGINVTPSLELISRRPWS